MSLFSYQYIIFGFPDMVQKGGHLTPMTLPWIYPCTKYIKVIFDGINYYCESDLSGT